MGLTPRQLEAVAVEQPPRDTCVVAGPGSGKTTVLVAHFERLVESGVDPLRILAITFTDKAANNMRDRLIAAFADRPAIRAKLERAYVSTVHGFCTRLLKENAVFAGLDPEFRVMDEREFGREQRIAVDEALDGMFREDPERMRALMRSLATIDAGAEVLEAYDAIRAAGVKVEALAGYPTPARPEVAPVIAQIRACRPPYDWKTTQLAHLNETKDWLKRVEASLSRGPEAVLEALQSFNCSLAKLKAGSVRDQVKLLRDDLLKEFEYSLVGEYFASERATILDLFIRFDKLYRERKRKLSGVDYDDLEEYAVRLLEEHPEARRRLQNQFERVLMDEFQDTNGRQAHLLELLRPPERFYAVGDINQSIYGFRHAEPRVFGAYRDAVADGGDRIVELVENFRSRPDILSVVLTAAGREPGVEYRPLIAGRDFGAKSEPSVEVLAAMADSIDNARPLEAQWTAARILELEGNLQVGSRAAEFRDFAVLMRNSEVFADFTRAFEDAGIPYVVNRAKGFYETREVVDMLQLLRVLVNPRDEIAMAAVMRSPFVNISDDALLRLARHGETHENPGKTLEALTAEEVTLYAADDAEKLTYFRDRLAAWRTALDYVPIDQLLLRAIDQCGYPYAEAPRTAANIEKFLAQARAAGARQTLAEFVEEMEILRKSKPREPDAPPEDSANAVKIMTVHAAKGLEFPVVFLAAMDKGTDTGLSAISFSPTYGLGARWKHPLGRAAKDDSKDDAFQHQIREERKQREAEESSRLLYVAMTRAEEHLVLSYSNNGKKSQNWAGVVEANLGVDLSSPADRTTSILAAGGRTVPVRVRCVTAPPRRVERRARQEAESAAQFADKPPLGEQYEGQATVTSISIFAECPRRYFLSRYLGFETPVSGSGEGGGNVSDLRASELGMQVHSLLAGANGSPPHPDAVRLADIFLKSALGRRAAAATTVEREFDFLMEIEGLVLRGQIDLWFEDRGRITLVDYKTDFVSAANAAARAGQYTLQLRLYALAIERLTGRMPDEAYVYFLQPNVAVPVDLRPSLFDSPETTVREFREAQERQHFPLREGAHCRTCPHFTHQCPARLAIDVPDVPIPV